jgi:hypothetical protein
LLFVFATHAGFAQKQSNDSIPEYMKRFHYYRLPGTPDSATFYKRIDSVNRRKILWDSLQQLKTLPLFNFKNFAYAAVIQSRN